MGARGTSRSGQESSLLDWSRKLGGFLSMLRTVIWSEFQGDEKAPAVAVKGPGSLPEQSITVFLRRMGNIIYFCY